MSELTLIIIPPHFAQDRDDRCLPMGTVEKLDSQGWHCRMTAEELADLKGDAEYYEDCGSTGWNMDFGSAMALNRSAKATLRRIATL